MRTIATPATVPAPAMQHVKKIEAAILVASGNPAAAVEAEALPFLNRQPLS